MSPIREAYSTAAVTKPTVSNPWLRGLAVAALVVVGVALLVLGGVALLNNRAAGQSTVNKTSTTTVDAPAKDKAGTTTTKVDSTDTTTPGKGVVRSETVAAALFGLGAIVFLTGVFFGRVQEIVLPGGAVLKLTQKQQEAVREQVAEEIKKDPELATDPIAVIEFYDAAREELLALSYPRAELGTSPGDDYVALAVGQAAQKVLRR